MRSFRYLAAALGISSAVTSSVAADDWSRFRGPNGNSIASESKHPVEWSEDSNVAWKVKIPGRGWSQPIATGDNVFVTTAVTENEEKPKRGKRARKKGQGASA